MKRCSWQLVCVTSSILCTLAKYQNKFSWHGGFKVIAKPQSIIRSSYLCKNPHELRWILIMTEAHIAKTVWGQKKRCLWGTFNSHNPQLTWTSEKSKASLKVRGDPSTYINHERRHHRKNPKAHKHHQVSVYKHFSQRHIFFPTFLFCFCISWFICFYFMCSCCLVNLDLQAFVHSVSSFFSSLHICSTLIPFGVNVHRASRTSVSTFKVWMTFKVPPYTN